MSLPRVNGEGRGASVPRLALSLDEAAEAIGLSRDVFDERVRPHLRVVPVGRRVLVPIRALDDFLEKSSIGA